MLAEDDRQPVIGISGANTSSKSVAAMVSQIRSAGAIPVFLGNHAPRIKDGLEQAVKADMARLDALVVMGNDGDIDPAKYGKPRHEKTNIETDAARAAYEEAALGAALEAGMPVLGVCGGMQRLNVLGSGTLHQHVPDIVGDNHHAQGAKDQGEIAPFVPVQFVHVEEGTKLAALAGPIPGLYTPQNQKLPPGWVPENSFHHQAVDEVRRDFRVAAMSDDGIIEAIEPKPDSKYGRQFVLGVQWHPEFGASMLGPKIASGLVQAAREYSIDRQKMGANPVDPAMAIEGENVARLMAARQQRLEAVARR
ncbi:MAG: gamma-glutamyl-gamma-aminobutyrate hydrolase family protein [Pseudomonadota bacterium]|nr:gamma-glutamyl-gamma-aminobutyrate hydrolase family protein [Pseudomonadota bacterium]